MYSRNQLICNGLHKKIELLSSKIIGNPKKEENKSLLFSHGRADVQEVTGRTEAHRGGQFGSWEGNRPQGRALVVYVRTSWRNAIVQHDVVQYWEYILQE